MSVGIESPSSLNVTAFIVDSDCNAVPADSKGCGCLRTPLTSSAAPPRTWARFIRYIGLADIMYAAELRLGLGFVRVCVLERKPPRIPKQTEDDQGFTQELCPCLSTKNFPQKVTVTPRTVYAFCGPPLQGRSAAWRVRVAARTGDADIIFGVASRPHYSASSFGPKTRFFVSSIVVRAFDLCYPEVFLCRRVRTIHQTKGQHLVSCRQEATTPA